MEKFIDLGKPTKRGIKRCPSCNTINGTRGARCKNKKCNIILRDNNSSIKLIGLANLVTHNYQPQQIHDYDSIKLVTDSPLELVSVRVNNRGNDYRSIVELPTIQDSSGKLINCLTINQQNNQVDASEFDRLLISNSKCYFENCIKQIGKTSASTDDTKIRTNNSCQHILLAVKCAKEALPLQLKSSSLSLLDITNDLKTDIMHLACQTPGPLVQRINRETFCVKCIDEEKFPFGFLHVYFHDVKDKSDSFSKKFTCTCLYYKKMIRLKICDISTVKRHCIHYYSMLATFLSDDELTKEFENILFNKEINEHDQIIKQQKHIKTEKKLIQSPDSQFQTILPSSNNIVNNSLITNNLNNNTINNNININTVNISNINTNATQQQNNNNLVNTQKKQQQQQQQVSNSKVTNEEIQPIINNISSNVGWFFTDWLSSVTEQINESMHYQINNHLNSLTFRIPNIFFDCIQQRITSVTATTTNSINKKFRMPNSMDEIERKEVPPFGVFIRYIWNIYNILHVKSIFDTNLKTLELQRLFIQKTPTTYELYQIDKNQQIDLNKQFFYKTFLKVGKMRIEQIEQSTPFIIEWIPNLYPKSQIGELTLKFEFGHLKPNETLY